MKKSKAGAIPKSFKREEVSGEKIKIENIPFHKPKRKPEEQKPKREIKLADLRKALEESLQIKEEPEGFKERSNEISVKVEEKKAEKKMPEAIIKEEIPVSSNKELQDRIEREKLEDKVIEDTQISESPQTRRKSIKPGETIKL